MNFIDNDEKEYLSKLFKDSAIIRFFRWVIVEGSGDIECLKYILKHGGIGGSTERLARSIRMMYITTFILMIVIVFFMNFDTQSVPEVIENVGK